MNAVAGIDIGNSTTECAIGVGSSEAGIRILGTGTARTTGVKGTAENLSGVLRALQEALKESGLTEKDLTQIRINLAAPVIGDVTGAALQTAHMTDSIMLGHNPDTPGGFGLACGYTSPLEGFCCPLNKDKPYLAMIGAHWTFEAAATQLNALMAEGYNITGVLVQKDDGVLIANRLKTQLPIVDEIVHLDRLERGLYGAIEVASPGRSVQTLANPYGIATLFGLSAEQTAWILPIARNLLGKQSAVVFQSSRPAFRQYKEKLGNLHFISKQNRESVAIESGGKAIMDRLAGMGYPRSIHWDPGTVVGDMLSSICKRLASSAGTEENLVEIHDLLAVDTLSAVTIDGSLANERYFEKSIAVAALAKVDHLPLDTLCRAIRDNTSCETVIGGIEGVMAGIGAMTTPGASLPLLIMDIGSGSTDMILIKENGDCTAMHFAGAGHLIDQLIQLELDLDDLQLAEQIKCCPAAQVQNLHQIKHENGYVAYRNEPVAAKYFGQTVLTDLGMAEWPILKIKTSIEAIAKVRRRAKTLVLKTNLDRALRVFYPEKKHLIPNMILVGGTAQDFEMTEILLRHLSEQGIVCGRGNVMGKYGPRKAVAVGLVLSYFWEGKC